MSSNRPSSGGVNIAGVLLIVFVVLKLTGLVDWSWLWVLAPLWVPLLVAGVILTILILLKA